MREIIVRCVELHILAAETVPSKWKVERFIHLNLDDCRAAGRRVERDEMKSLGGGMGWVEQGCHGDWIRKREAMAGIEHLGRSGEQISRNDAPQVSQKSIQRVP